MGTAVSVALPAIQSHFQTNLGGIQWVVNAYLLSLASFLMIGGSLGDYLGRKRVFISGMALFALAATLSGLAASSVMLIAFQGLQGVGSALMVPQSLAIINDCFPESRRGQAIGLWAGLSGGVAMLGPLLSGWLIEAFSWRAAFFMGVPILMAALAVTLRFVPVSRKRGARHLDWWGTLLILLGLGGIAYGLINGPAEGWKTPLALAGLGGGVVAIVLFILFESRVAQPLVPLRIFRNPLVAGANTLTLFLYFALNGLIFFLVLNFQQVRGYSPVQAGLGLLPAFVLITLLSGPAGALADRIGPRWQMILGPTTVAAGIALLAIGGSDARYLRDFMPGLLLFGVGMALVIAPLTKSALAVEPRFSGAASGVNNAVSRVAGLLAVAALGAVMVSAFAAHLNGAVAVSGLAPEEQRQILEQSDKLAAINIPVSFSEVERRLAREAIVESFVYAFRWAMGVSATLAFAGALVCAFAIRSPPRNQPPGPGGSP